MFVAQGTAGDTAGTAGIVVAQGTEGDLILDLVAVEGDMGNLAGDSTLWGIVGSCRVCSDQSLAPCCGMAAMVSGLIDSGEWFHLTLLS